MSYLYFPSNDPIDNAIVGGKATSLWHLTRRGFAVPPWFCVTSHAFDAFIQPVTERLVEMSRALDADDGITVTFVANELQNCLEGCDIPAQLLEVILPALRELETQRVAVRSSATAEDSSEHSFAGIFETYLNVPQHSVVKMIKHCWLSAFSATAVDYAKRKQLPLTDLKMAVLVQNIISADRSGVLFQSNPAGNLNEIAIVAGYGLGEGIVQNRVGTDTILLDRSTGAIESTIGDKAESIRSDCEEGVIMVPVPTKQRRRPVLHERQLGALKELDSRLLDAFDELQDVEWSFDTRGKLWILQSRDITTIPPGDINLFDNSNIVESFPGVSTPLTVSLVRKIYYRMFYHMFLHCGYSRRTLAIYDSVLENLVVSIQGRLYYNLSNWYKMMALYPLSASLFVPALEESIGVPTIPFRDPPAGGWQRPMFAVGLLARYCFYQYEFYIYKRRYAALLNDVGKRLTNARTETELIGLFEYFFKKIFYVEQFGRLSDSYMMACLYIAKRLLRHTGLSEEEASSIINGALVSEPGLESVKPVQSIQSIARALRREQALLDRLEGAQTWSSVKEILQAGAPAVLTAIEDHLEQYGDRSLAELKFETATFREDPMSFVQVVIAYAQSRAFREVSDIEEGDLRIAAERQLYAVCTGIRRPIARYVLHKVRQFVVAREYTRLNRARYYGVIRSIYRRIAENWQRRNVIVDAGDIFYLEHSEVCEVIAGRSSANIQEIVSHRKADAKAKTRCRPRHRMWLKGDVELNDVPQESEVEVKRSYAPTLVGTGCCPGKARAECAIILDPLEAKGVDGKILVAENTDPGWAFLIMKAKGLIMEKGSMLSHTAIIGREMGIPTIVGVQGATKLISAGAELEMDGSSGVIRVVDEVESRGMQDRGSAR